MADSKHVEPLIHSVQEWNLWRKNHPDIPLNLSSASLSSIYLNNANLSGAHLSGAHLIRAHLNGANFTSADLSGAHLSGAHLSGAHLSGANLSDAHLSGATLSKANLSGATLSKANLSSTNLSGAHLRRAYLSDVHLRNADLRNADLSGADLSDADLSGANLSKAHLNGADLSGANLSGADLSGANLSKAHLRGTIFVRVDLCTTKGLIEINHEGRSIVELHSIQLPEDGSALHFLRGVGIPDEWIDFYRAAMMHPIQYYSCFLSYSSADDLIAKRLHADLQANGVRCWFAPHDLKPGNYIRKEIDQAIHLQDKLLLILSESAVKSGWIGYEVELAIAREIRQQREILFPIRLDNKVLESTSRWVTSLQAIRHISDFTNWTDPQTYRQIFDRLLRDLKKADA